MEEFVPDSQALPSSEPNQLIFLIALRLKHRTFNYSWRAAEMYAMQSALDVTKSKLALYPFESCSIYQLPTQQAPAFSFPWLSISESGINKFFRAD